MKAFTDIGLVALGALIKIRLMVEELCTEPIKEKKEDKKDV